MNSTAVMAMLAFFVGLAGAARAEDYEVRRTLQLSVSMPEVWRVVGDFCDIDDWHPALSGCVLRVVDGRLHRQLATTEGAEILERRIAVEPGLSYTYRIESSPLPVEGFTATFAIAPNDGSLLSWSARFSSDDPAMEAVIGGLFDSGLAAIETMIDGG